MENVSKCPDGLMSGWVNVRWVNVRVGKGQGGKCLTLDTAYVDPSAVGVHTNRTVMISGLYVPIRLSFYVPRVPSYVKNLLVCLYLFTPTWFMLCHACAEITSC